MAGGFVISAGCSGLTRSYPECRAKGMKAKEGFGLRRLNDSRPASKRRACTQVIHGLPLFGGSFFFCLRFLKTLAMKYLIHPTRPGTAAHILDQGMSGERDTFCRLYSTGGIGSKAKKKMVISESTEGRHICLMCSNVYKRFNPAETV
jgi:hypothetical protein